MNFFIIMPKRFIFWNLSQSRKAAALWMGLLAAFAVTTAWGIDTPPSWRGTALTTYDVWNFATSSTAPVPDVYNNAYGTPSGSINYDPPYGTGWYGNNGRGSYTNAAGSVITSTNSYGSLPYFWDIASGSMTLNVPVPPSTSSHLAACQIQVTYYIDISYVPSVTVASGAQSGTQIGSTVTTYTGLHNKANGGNPRKGGNWWTDLYTFSMLPSTSPDVVTISGDPSSGSFVSQVIVDTMVTNHPPVAQTLNVIRTAGTKLLIPWSNLAANWSDPDGDTVALTGFNLVSTNGGLVLTNSTWILYTNSLNANDQLSYTVNDGWGGTNTGYINIVVNPFVTGQNATVTVSGSSASLTFYGIPGYTYTVQRATAVNGPWVNIATTTVGAGGTINVTDTFQGLGGPPSSAYYQLEWNP